MKYYRYIETPLGSLTACEEDNLLTELFWDKIPVNGMCKDTNLLNLLEKEIKAYFRKEITCFSIPYRLKGTDFQKEVWHALSQVPYGSTISYQELARRSGHPKACRAVGTACSRNPINLIIPCHRIVNKNGSPGNYRGGNERKRHLLTHECCELSLFQHSVIYL